MVKKKQGSFIQAKNRVRPQHVPRVCWGLIRFFACIKAKQLTQCFRNRLYTLFKLGFIICRPGYILAGGNTGCAEDRRKYNSHNKVEDNRRQSLKHAKFLSANIESENGG